MTQSANKPDYPYETYKPVKSPMWWLRHRRYFLFMMRELTSLFVGAFSLLLLYQFYLLSQGDMSFAQFRASLQSPGYLAFYTVAFLFALYHTVTWFGALSKIQVVRLGKRKVPPALVTAGAFAGWIVVSALVALIFLMG